MPLLRVPMMHWLTSSFLKIPTLHWLTSCIACLATPVLLSAEDLGKIRYDWTVALLWGESSQLTPRFQEGFSRELQQSLKLSLGELAKIEVLDLKNVPESLLIKAVREKGLTALDATFSTAGNRKFHFVEITFKEGKYRVRSRRWDESIGLASEITPTESTADRKLLNKLTLNQLLKEFGWIGSMEWNGGLAQVSLQGQDLASLKDYIQKGDLFEVVKLQKITPKATKGEKSPPPRIVPSKVEGMLIQITSEPERGKISAKVLNRYRNTLAKESPTLSYKLIKVPAEHTVLKLRLVDPNGQPFRAGQLRVRVRDDQYPDLTRPEDEMIESEPSLFTSRTKLDRLAYVLVTTGDTPLARIPVEVSGQVIVRKVSLDPKVELKSRWAEVMNDFLSRIRTERIIQNKSFEELQGIQTRDRTEALNYAEKALKLQRVQLDLLKNDLDRQKNRAQEDGFTGSFDPCETELRAFETRISDLAKHTEKLREVVRLENDPETVARRKKVESLLLEAKLLVEQAEIPQALTKYTQALNETMENEPVRKEISKILEDLNKDWKEKDATHATARKFIYEIWPKLETPQEIAEKLTEARRCFQICQTNADKYALRKMFLSGAVVAEKFAEGIKPLTMASAETEEELATRKRLQEAGESLQTLLTDLAKALK